MKTLPCGKCAHPLHVEAEWTWDFKKCPVCGAKTMLPADWQRALPEDGPAPPAAEPETEPWQPPTPALHTEALPRRGPIARACYVLAAAAFLAACGSILVALLTGLVSYLGREGRLTTAGTIVRSEVREHPARRRLTSYSPLVVVEYHVSGKTYTSSRMAFWETMEGSRTLAERAVARYPLHAHAQVHYEYDDPADGVLDVSWKWQPVWVAAAALLGAWLAVRVLLCNSIADERARATGRGMFTRRWRPLDLVAAAVLAVVGVLRLFNLFWFE
jgi:hypothetical protein